jgi:hypothetical protein
MGAVAESGWTEGWGPPLLKQAVCLTGFYVSCCTTRTYGRSRRRRGCGILFVETARLRKWKFSAAPLPAGTRWRSPLEGVLAGDFVERVVGEVVSSLLPPMPPCRQLLPDTRPVRRPATGKLIERGLNGPLSWM